MSSSRIDVRRIAWRQILLGGLIVALGDFILAATLWFGWNLPGFARLFQTIAVGVLGKASYDGGATTAWLGAGLHLFMATVFVVVYALAGRRVPTLLQKPFAYGAAYGVVLYVVMNFVVMPLSRVDASPSFEHPDWIFYSVIAHMLFGVICVLFARRALRPR
jgi:ABC-type xylose transport system permease subunit